MTKLDLIYSAIVAALALLLTVLTWPDSVVHDEVAARAERWRA